MVTLERRRQSEFDDDPEFDVVRSNLAALEECVLSAPESRSGYEGGSYLSNKLFTLKNRNTVEILPNDPHDNGNNLLPTIFNATSSYLLIYIDARHVGVQEGRGRIEVKPLRGGLSVEALEFDVVKKASTAEAHGLRRVIYREYNIPGAFDWNRLEYSVSLDDTLIIRVPTNNFPTFRC